MDSEAKENMFQQPRTIRSAQTWEEPLEIIRAIDGLQGSGEFFYPDELEEDMQAVREGRLSLQALTRTDGFREKIAELMERELKAGE